MESVIIYELARNNVYGSLSRALAGLQQNCMGMLAVQRAQIKPAFKNDLYFYFQVRTGRALLSMLQEFCDARLHGESFEDARHQLMKKFTDANAPAFDERNLKLLPGSYRDEMKGATDLEKEGLYRYRHLDEFRTVVHTLDRYFHQHHLKTWPSEIIFNQIYNRLDSFVDPQIAEKGFDKFPIPAEVQYLADATKWFKQRSLMAQVKAMPHMFLHTPGQGGLLEKMSGDNWPDKVRLAQYAVHCESIGAGLAEMIASGGFVPVLGEACKIPKGYLPATFTSVTAKIKVDLPKAVHTLLSDYKDNFARDIRKVEDNPDFCAASVAAAEEVMADFLAQYPAVQPQNSEPAAPKRTKRELAPA